MVTLNSEISMPLTEIQSVQAEQRKTLNIAQRFVKRFFDILVGIIGIIGLAPLTLVVYIVRKALHEDEGPIFYKQLRIGKNGDKFWLYKYRTMVLGADDILKQYLAENEEAREEYKINKKLKNDPRITKVGKLLRKLSIDEIPQFINVLKGDMSLIGPRPYLPREQLDMENYYEDIIQVRPGLTGLWQVSGAGHASFEERLKLEKQYVNNCSIKQDVKIFFKTFKAMICGHGAGM